MAQFVIDSNNHHPITGAELITSRAVALFAKGTEGTTYKDPTYEAQRAAARQAGVPFGGYTYIHWNDPGEQFKFFLEYAQPKPGDLQPAVDAEDPAANAMELAKRAYACLTALEHEGYEPLLYASADRWKLMILAEPRLKRFRIWEADYPGRFARWFPWLAKLRIKLAHGATVVMWQWTSTFAVGTKTFDCSRLFVDVDTLRIPSAAEAVGGKASAL